MSVPSLIRGLQIRHKPKTKLVQIKKIMGHPPLPHELNQWHKTEDFEHLKIAHKLYTFRSGSGIPQVGRYGGLKWKRLVSGYGSTSRIPLGTEFWLARL